MRRRRWIWLFKHDGHHPCNRTDSLHYYSPVIMFYSEDTILLTRVEESLISRFSSTWYPSDCQSVPVFLSLFACENIPVVQCNVHLSILFPHCSTKSCTVNSHGIRPDGNLPATSLSNQPPSALVSTHGNENTLKLFDPLLRLP